VNFRAKIGEEKEIGEHHIIFNLQELLDSTNLFPNEEIKYYYKLKTSQANYFRTNIISDYFIEINVSLKREAIKPGYYIPDNGCNVSKELSLSNLEERISFDYDPPYDPPYNAARKDYLFIYSIEPYVPFRLSPYFLVPAMVVADIVTSPIQILFYLTYESPR
jgi:hypothetical protein